MTTLTKELALGSGGCSVNCILDDLTERDLREIRGFRSNTEHPRSGCLGPPEDVAATAGFLASEGSSWITGVTLDVAGGSVLV